MEGEGRGVGAAVRRFRPVHKAGCGGRVAVFWFFCCLKRAREKLAGPRTKHLIAHFITLCALETRACAEDDAEYDAEEHEGQH